MELIGFKGAKKTAVEIASSLEHRTTNAVENKWSQIIHSPHSEHYVPIDRRRTWTVRETERLRRLKMQGKLVSEIAGSLNRTPRAVEQHWIKVAPRDQAGAVIRPRRRSQLGKTEAAMARQQSTDVELTNLHAHREPHSDHSTRDIVALRNHDRRTWRNIAPAAGRTSVAVRSRYMRTQLPRERIRVPNVNHWSEADISKLVALRNEGASIGRIADALPGRTPHAIQSAIWRYVPRDQESEKDWQHLGREIYELREQGWAWKQIGLSIPDKSSMTLQTAYASYVRATKISSSQKEAGRGDFT